jgi:hypothetical protein
VSFSSRPYVGLNDVMDKPLDFMSDHLTRSVPLSESQVVRTTPQPRPEDVILVEKGCASIPE